MDTRKLKGQKNQCQVCKEYFNSNYAFSKHRVGAYEKHKKNGVVVPNSRRCASPSEMGEAGMSLSVTGWWIASKMKNDYLSEKT